MTHTLKFILALLLLVGCQNEELISPDDNRPNPDGSVGFRLQIEGSDIGSDSSKTKGTPHDDLGKYSTVQVKVYAHTADYEATTDKKDFFRDIELKQEASNWKYTPPMFWPIGKKLSFVAYASDIAFAPAGITFLPRSGELVPDSIKYNVPTDVTSQPDLLVSTKYNQPVMNNVSLNMKHALSCVSFVGIAPEADTYVKSITLRNVYSEGKFALKNSSIEWIVNPDSIGITVYQAGVNKDQALGEAPPEGNNDYLMTANGYLMMIPQKLKDPAIDVLYWNGKDDAGNKVITYVLPIDDESYNTWKPGMKYVYKFGSQSEKDITVVYYEKYADGYGLYYYEEGKLQNSLHEDETKIILEAGYGVLAKQSIGSAKIRLGTPSAVAVTAGTEVNTAGFFLYPVNQTGSESHKFALTASTNPLNVYVNDSDKPCGMIVPHFAKGVYTVNTLITKHKIRTPQQIRNISELTTVSEAFDVNKTFGATFTQERNLDFSAPDIGGGDLSGAVVDQVFYGTYNSDLTKSISNVTINTTSINTGLFSRNKGSINNLILKSSTIKGTTNVGGIVGENMYDGIIDKPQIIGIDAGTGKTTIEGSSSIGGIVGDNSGTVNGNTAYEDATEITVAAVSGWVDIEGTGADDNGSNVGGIAGQNRRIINTILVNGVYVTVSGALELSKINITGAASCVGGIVGLNWNKVTGNITGTGKDIKNMPDVAGIVEITGASYVGGIVGLNTADGELNSVNVRLGREPAMKITGSGAGVGGVVGENRGKMGTGSNNTFISARGNIEITGAEAVGGIVGSNNLSTAKLINCFVYDFQTQVAPIKYFAPKITSTGKFAGGIAGKNIASIENCAVFSVSDKTLSITSNTNAGGIAGYSETANSLITGCSFVGRVMVGAKSNSGGILGSNSSGTKIEHCWVGNSDGNGVIKNAIDNLHLVITLPAGNPPYGVPDITGDEYIGGIVGLNSGEISGITLSDNVMLGRYTSNYPFNGSNYVGGIVGGNTTTGTISNCNVENADGKNVIIQGTSSVGGIVGLNNGLIEGGLVNAPADVSRLTINGTYNIGGIAGQNGGHKGIVIGNQVGTGDDNTIIKKCNVTGYVTVKGLLSGSGAYQVGGIVGLNGPNKDNIQNIDSCHIDGGSDTNSILISVSMNAGGIAGTNSGNINDCSVRNATIRSASKSDLGYAGGIAGQTSATAATFTAPSDYRSDINDCTVFSGVTIEGPTQGTPPVDKIIAPGALVGFIDAISDIVFGKTTANKVSSSGVSVNGTPITSTTPLDKIVGYATNGATIEYETVP